jgi:hypothetical protein
MHCHRVWCERKERLSLFLQAGGTICSFCLESAFLPVYRVFDSTSGDCRMYILCVQQNGGKRGGGVLLRLRCEDPLRIGRRGRSKIREAGR